MIEIKNEDLGKIAVINNRENYTHLMKSSNCCCKSMYLKEHHIHTVKCFYNTLRKQAKKTDVPLIEKILTLYLNDDIEYISICYL